MTQNNITETRTASIHIDKNDIVIITMKNCGKVDEYDVVDFNLVLRHLTGGKPVLKLFDGRANWSMDRKAKERAKLENSAHHTLARAVVVSNFIKAALFKYLHELGKKGFPQEFFTDKDEAYKWLLSLKEKPKG
ncbi:MAG: hypothetical protein IPJ60_10920 [Sphingobacteriaceae bacterium]|nr:hypothetical protein [Sphingobacteriaceae bacterium]